VEQREDARKVFDHYEKKLEKLEEKKDVKMKEGSYSQGSDFFNELTRNEEKYISAKDDYVKKAINAYDTIDNLNSNRFNLVTPVLLNLYFVEMKLYESFSTKYGEYKDLEDKLSVMKEEFLQKKKKNIYSYNPMMHTKSPHLEDKFSKKKKRQ